MGRVIGSPASPSSFRPGTSGNPGGRPADRELSAIARRYAVDALRALVEVCRNAHQHPSARVAAASALLDRGFGKPRQEVDIAGNVGTALHLHLYAVQRLEAVQAVATALEAPPIEGDAESLRDDLLPPGAPEALLPDEALPLWQAAHDKTTPTREGDDAAPGDADA